MRGSITTRASASWVKSGLPGRCGSTGGCLSRSGWGQAEGHFRIGPVAPSRGCHDWRGCGVLRRCWRAIWWVADMAGLLRPTVAISRLGLKQPWVSPVAPHVTSNMALMARAASKICHARVNCCGKTCRRLPAPAHAASQPITYRFCWAHATATFRMLAGLAAHCRAL